MREAYKNRAAVIANEKTEKAAAGLSRRNPGRMDGVQYRASYFICANQIDDPAMELSEDEYDEGSEDEDDAVLDDLFYESGSEQEVEEDKKVVSLLDMARPAKQKGSSVALRPRLCRPNAFGAGVAKEFEFVQGMDRVIALEDEKEAELEDSEEDEWEVIYDSDGPAPSVARQESYSEVLQGKGTG